MSEKLRKPLRYYSEKAKRHWQEHSPKGVKKLKESGDYEDALNGWWVVARRLCAMRIDESLMGNS